MPSPYSSVEVSESVLMPVCVCVSVCYCVVYVFFASVPSVLIKELSQALLNIHIHSFLDCYFVLSLSHMRAHARTHAHTHMHTQCFRFKTPLFCYVPTVSPLSLTLLSTLAAAVDLNSVFHDETLTCMCRGQAIIQELYLHCYGN